MRLWTDLEADISSVPGVVIGVVAFLIAVVIGLMMWYKIDGAVINALGSRAGVGTSFAGFNTTITAINTTANSTWTLAPIVGLVLIAGVIIATIIMFAGGKQSV